MMQATDLTDDDHISNPVWHDQARVRTIFVEREMRAGALVIVDVRRQDAAQMALVEDQRCDPNTRDVSNRSRA